MTEENENVLKQSILQYEMQLQQIDLAISATDPGSERDQLLSLKEDIQQLISLTSENLAEIIGDTSPKKHSKNVDPLAAEYDLFKAEIEAETLAQSGSENTEQPETDIQTELEELQGMKCQAPFSHGWGTSYHNALVCSVEPSDNITTMQQIQIRVMFTNPTQTKMIPCSYYLEGECRFDSSKCRFSHGELVHLSELREYKEPNFNSIKEESSVFVLNEKDKLWHRGQVLHEIQPGVWEVQIASGGSKVQVELKHMLPLENDNGTSSDHYSESDADDDDDDLECEESNEGKSKNEINFNAWDNMSTSALGSWEKHTKGIGSRLMRQMGYVVGTGLGPNADGRVEPVEAVVLPPGKSLDHCMNLKSQFGSTNLLKNSKRLKKLQKKHEQQQKAIYEREKNRSTIFDFLNSKLGDKSSSKVEAASCSNSGFVQKEKLESLKTNSSQDLNVASLRVSEELKKVNKELSNLEDSLRRQSKGSQAHQLVTNRISQKQKEIFQLEQSEKRITAEQSKRKGNKKISIF